MLKKTISEFAQIISGILAFSLIGIGLIQILLDNRLGLPLFTLGIAFFSLFISFRSDEKMTALTYLEFDEKITMFGKYKNAIESCRDAIEDINKKKINQNQLKIIIEDNLKELEKGLQDNLEGFKNDLKAASNLTNYFDEEQKSKVITEYVTPIIENAKEYSDKNEECKNLINEIKIITQKFRTKI